MRLSRFRPRFTVQWLMAAVAIIGLMSCIGREVLRSHRARTFDAIRSKHLDVWVKSVGKPGQEKTAEFHKSMMLKYQEATFNPWLTVAPDPPEPD